MIVRCKCGERQRSSWRKNLESAETQRGDEQAAAAPRRVTSSTQRRPMRHPDTRCATGERASRGRKGQLTLLRALGSRLVDPASVSAPDPWPRMDGWAWTCPKETLALRSRAAGRSTIHLDWSPTSSAHGLVLKNRRSRRVRAVAAWTTARASRLYDRAEARSRHHPRGRVMQ